MLTCCRCHEELDTDLPPAIDFRSGGLVCVQCHDEEVAARASVHAFMDQDRVRMAEVSTEEVWE